MDWAKTRVLKQQWDVDSRLHELGLTRHALLAVRDIALAEAANTTPNHCANAWGTFSYQYGTWALRDKFAGPEWRPSRAEGVESIYNKELNVRIAFCNVDVSCNEAERPKPRSDKGAGAERACQGNLFGDLPTYAPTPRDACAYFYLMVAQNGACELSMPVIEAGSFAYFVERIYLSDGSDYEAEMPAIDDGDDAADFDPVVTRKA